MIRPRSLFLTVAAIGTSVASGVLGAKIGAQAPTPSATATEPNAACELSSIVISRRSAISGCSG